MLGDEELVRSVLNDVDSSSLPEAQKALIGFLRNMTKHLPEMANSDSSA
jgi:hypothetical protein